MIKLVPVFLAVAILAVIVAAVMLSRSADTETDTNITPLPPVDDGQVYCTQDAKMCPDGSYVGRTGPKCEFSPCPGIK